MEVITEVQETLWCYFCGKTQASRLALVGHVSLCHSHQLGESATTTGTPRSASENECQYCDKQFTQRSSLNAHMRTHSGDRPFSCPKCSKSFSRKLTLTRHLQTHSGIKPFQCKVCGKGLSRKHVLNQHMKIHTREQLEGIQTNEEQQDNKIDKNETCV